MKTEMCSSKVRCSSTRRGLLLRSCIPAAAMLISCLGANGASDSGSFPQIGSIWWGESIYAANPAQAEKFQLFLAPNFDVAAATAVRAADPTAPQLTTINAMETTNGAPAVPDSYY